MELREIKRLVYGGESAQVEFKRKINHPEKVIREVVAFANSGGGHLLVGVDDDKSIVGCKYADEEHFLLQKAIRELIRPAVKYTAELIPLNEKRAILHYEIFAGNRKPYFAFEKKYHRYGKAFVRVEDRSIQASPEIRKILKFNNDPKDTHFQYGANEKLLFNYLDQNEKVTVNEFREMSGLDYRSASSTMVQMVLANALRIIPREQEDWYMAVE
ncbi:AlbA family DNA-binding domain-containing protein [Marinoscillum furvescens]|uniref:Putative DNA-binding protein n=1 Tax=Marinoscillum furvescens DSM 4134 TaxID=1122208 RepID=A0A3D9L876_MARFU|nr:ATP-binding protein [Marinoscillum furvescens]REE01496.1 putative DNA-binding protein [Marinoscillum furvescens DSM 4134]